MQRNLTSPQSKQCSPNLALQLLLDRHIYFPTPKKQSVIAALWRTLFP